MNAGRMLCIFLLFNAGSCYDIDSTVDKIIPTGDKSVSTVDKIIQPEKNCPNR